MRKNAKSKRPEAERAGEHYLDGGDQSAEGPETMIFIEGNVPSSKNSKVATKTGVFNSRTVARYLQRIGVRSYSSRHGVQDYQRRDNLFRKSVGDYFKDIQYPAVIGFHFVRDSRRRFDFHNVVQIIADLLVAHGFIDDDNMDCMIPIPMRMNDKWYSVDKNAPGVFVKLFDERLSERAEQTISTAVIP